MDPSLVDHVFLISCVQCIIVICFTVSIETLSTTETVRSVPDDSVTEDVSRGEPYMDPPCPPVDSLHLVCDVNIGNPTTCQGRALIIQQCLYRFSELYKNSRWDTCLTDVNFCFNIVQLLLRENLINKTVLNNTKFYTTTQTSGTSAPISDTITSESTTITTSKDVKTVIPVNDINVTSSVTWTPVSSSTTMEAKVAEPNTDVFPPPLSYIYPIIGSLLILIEIVALCAFFCYQKKRGPHYKKHRRPSTGSGGVQEEAITAQTASPVNASPHMNSLYSEDEVVKEDQNIFNSYLNLRFIDESEEPTPAKKLLRL